LVPFCGYVEGADATQHNAALIDIVRGLASSSESVNRCGGDPAVRTSTSRQTGVMSVLNARGAKV